MEIIKPKIKVPSLKRGCFYCKFHSTETCIPVECDIFNKELFEDKKTGVVKPCKQCLELRGK